MDNGEKFALFSWVVAVVATLYQMHTLRQIRDTLQQEHYSQQTFRERFALHFPYEREEEMEEEEYRPDLQPTLPSYIAEEAER